MKALQFKGYGKLRGNIFLGDVPKPQIREGQVLVQVHAASVNPVDYKIVNGNLKLLLRLKLPAVFGYDFAGVVTEAGNGVDHVKMGDTVYGSLPSISPGTFAEFAAVDADVVALKPKNLNFIEAACIPLVGLTTVQVFNKSNLKRGDKVLIHAGSGGIGTLAIQYAKAKGAFVYTTTSTQNTEWVKDLGADRVIDYKNEDYKKIAKDLDVVYDTLGGQYTLDAFDQVKPGGHVTSIAGGIDGETVKALGLPKIIQWILFFKGRKIRKRAEQKGAHYNYVLMDPNREQVEQLTALIQQGAIKPVLDKVYDLDDGVEALVHQQSGRAKGKIVIKMR
ncbi:NADP-dependent oxidoreductase [Flavobacteriaceae bacterium F89]|uniref:NADP-dependent oxidoreductase n=1 Tax=Cerina litoralis TaxID=2874477 RepID=A0AAE3EV02_9FLAO|nr:NADP-dependent oxidoreductase [Cerina litoralis]MCG2460226.1 NADP-dependent oxidoreductase [Cerina litoralis]